jgi:hypothetical protein
VPARAVTKRVIIRIKKKGERVDMKIKLLVGLLFGLGVASIAEAFRVNNETMFPVRISFEFHGWTCGNIFRDVVIDATVQNTYYKYAPCDLKWIHYYVNYDGTWKYEGTSRFKIGGKTSPQTVDFYLHVDTKTGEPKVLMKIY